MSPLFFIAILAFMVLGFQRGWRRELVSLVFVLLASGLIHPDTSDHISAFLGNIPPAVAVIAGSQNPGIPQPIPFLQGPLWSLIIFGGLVVLGYFVGNRVFPGKPGTTHERFIALIPGLLSGVFVLLYLRNYIQTATGQSSIPLDFANADPGNYVPVIFVIAILALVVALIAARVKKAQAPGKK